MKRSPLKRKARLRPKRTSPRRSSRVRNGAYMERVRGLPCMVPVFLLGDEYDALGALLSLRQECYGPTHAHHMRELAKAGMGQKPSDDLCTSFCERHHDDWHSHSGVFKGKSKEWRIAFALTVVQETRARLGWKGDDDG